MFRGARSPTGSPTSYGSLATSTAVLVTSFTSPTTSSPKMPAALWPGIVQTYSNVPALFARNTIVVADPTPTKLSDWALNAGTATSCIAPSPLITVIATTEPSGTFHSGLTRSFIAPASPTQPPRPSETPVHRVQATTDQRGACDQPATTTREN